MRENPSARSLARTVLEGDEPHCQARRCFRDRLGVGRTVLLPLHKGFHIGLWDQPNIVTQSGDLALPVMRAGAGLHRNDAGRMIGEEC